MPLTPSLTQQAAAAAAFNPRFSSPYATAAATQQLAAQQQTAFSFEDQLLGYQTLPITSIPVSYLCDILTFSFTCDCNLTQIIVVSYLCQNAMIYGKWHL